MAAQSPPGDDSPLRQGAGGDLLNPPRWDWRRRRLSKVFRIVALGTGGFATEALSRRKGDVRGLVGPPNTRAARPPWAAPPPCVGPLWPLSGGSRVFWKLHAILRCWALISSDSENISLLGFLKPKTAENSNWPFGISSIGQFRKTHKYDIKYA